MTKNSIDKIESIAESNYLNLYEVDYHNKKGQLKKWFVASRKKKERLLALMEGHGNVASDAAILVPIHEQTGKLVLIRQYRVPVNQYVYELPAGLIEPDEALEDCVARELREETGLTLVKIHHEKTQQHIYASAGMTDETLDLVYVTCTGVPSDAYLEADEDISVHLCDQSEVADLLAQNIAMDVKALLICQNYMAFGSKMWGK